MPGAELASKLILQICGGEASEMVIAGEIPDVSRKYFLRENRIKELGGVDISREEVERILTVLGFQLHNRTGGWDCCVPSWRHDVMDEAETRRGIEAVNHRWGNLTAILAGDFLLAKASELAASLGTEVAELLAATIGHLCEGQVRELQLIYDIGRSEEQYLQAISGKTAALYATSCRIGGIVSGADRSVVDQLSEFGHAYGMAFQVVDDILDLIATDEELGKPSGNALREGVYTLPVIRMIADDHPVTELLGQQLDEETRDQARAIVVEGPEIATSVATAQEFVDNALAALDGLPATPGVQGMRDATTSLLSTLER